MPSRPPAQLAPLAPGLPSRSVLDLASAQGLETRFEALASATRLRLLHSLIVLDDPCMGDLAGSVGMKPQAVSNQLRRLVDMGILATRRHGNHVHYRIVDAGIPQLLLHALALDEATRPKPREKRP